MLTGAALIYDVHEDVPESIRNKIWIPRPFRAGIALIYRTFERVAVRFIDGVTLADHAYTRYYRGTRQLVVLNYPLLTYADYYRPEYGTNGKRPVLVYTGSLTALRGLFEMLALARDLKSEQPDLLLDLVGPIGSAREERRALELVRDYGIEENVRFVGLVSHAEVHRHILDADVGLALLHPDPNYLRSLPTKMFEYMMMGKAVVVSNFPLWVKILDEARCGIAIDPLSPTQALAATKRLLDDPDAREQMGRRGREMVLAKYNWERQSADLIDFYRSLLAGSDRQLKQAPHTDR
jgi:glycosyltransferase involved in cell wall biosynthesis